MAAYCAKADLVERYGAVELAQLTDETAAAAADDAEISKACDEATSLVDAYLAKRYTLPLVTVPTIVRKLACDIARKFLWKDRAGAESVVSQNYDAALTQLRDIARGISGLPDASGLAPASSGGSLKVVSADQVFSDELLSVMP